MQPDSLPPEVVEALKLGRPVEAVKRLRKSTNIGLAEAKALIDAFSKGNTAYQSPSAIAARKQKKQKQADAGPGPGPEPARSEPGHRHEYITPPPDPALGRYGLGPGEVRNSNASFWVVLFLIVVAVLGYYVLD